MVEAGVLGYDGFNPCKCEEVLEVFVCFFGVVGVMVVVSASP